MSKLVSVIMGPIDEVIDVGHVGEPQEPYQKINPRHYFPPLELQHSPRQQQHHQHLNDPIYTLKNSSTIEA